MRKVVGWCVVLVAFLLLIKSLHLGLRHRIENSTAARAAEETDAKVENWLDKTPPTAPQGLSAGAAPAIIYAGHYLNRAFLTKHTAPTFDSTGGNLIVACASSHNGVTLTPSDSYNNTWISIAGPTTSSAGFDLRSQIWYAKNPRVGPNHTFSMQLSSGQALVIAIFVVKGASLSNPVDAVSTIGDDAGTRTTEPTSPNIRTLNANDLLIGFGKSAISETWSAGEGFAFQPLASSDFLVAESGFAGNAGLYNSTFALNLPADWQASVVAIEPAANAAPQLPVSLAWHTSTDNVGVAEYQIERCKGVNCANFSQIATAKDTSFVDTSLDPSASYRYRVRAVDAASNASGYSNAIEADATTSRD
ncbi:MAG TPA: fibronectin type III domain-containing protein [Candidatus Acidoferrales bacterium]